jgi:arylsulfatase A-like enzyme
LIRRAGLPPNIVIILADDLGSADLGFRGSEIQTPHIDRLASQGVRFGRFYSFPLCSPTRSALMTGRSPVRYGVMYEVIKSFSTYGVPPEEHFIPETFLAAGYQTAIVGKWHLGHARAHYLPNARGFEHAYGFLNGAIDYFTHVADRGLDWHRDGRTLREEGYATDLIAAEAVRVIGGRDRGRPMFLYLPFSAPHGPLQAPERLIEKYAAIANRGRRTYAAMVDALDQAVGRVLAALDQEGLRDNTLVLFFSDNGGHVPSGASNAPLRGSKATAFEGGMRGPALMRWPARLRANTATPQVMTVMDVFPTLAAAAGITPANKLPLDGRNLWPEIAAGRSAPREELFFGVESRGMFRLAVFHREWKLVREVPESGDGTNYLFRIEDDPNETNDLAARHPDVVRDLAGRIEKWRSLHPPGGTRATDAPPPGWRAPQQWAEAAT